MKMLVRIFHAQVGLCIVMSVLSYLLLSNFLRIVCGAFIIVTFSFSEIFITHDLFSQWSTQPVGVV